MNHPALILAAAEFQEGLRNRWVLAVISLLATLAFSLALLGSAPIGETRASLLSITTVSLASLSIYLIPLIALLLSFDAITGELERGTLLLLLTYPIQRWHVISGKFLGHLAILATAILLGYGSAGLYVSFSGDTLAGEWLQFTNMMFSSLILGGVFIAIGYLVSVSVASRATAAGYAVGVWLLVVVLYDLLLLGLVLADTDQQLNRQLFGSLIMLNPADIYRLFNLAGSESASLVAGTSGLQDELLLTPSAMLGLLTVWMILPLLLAIGIFHRKEL